MLPAAVYPVLARAGASAVRTDFAASVTRTLWFQVGVFALAFLLMFAWPRGAGRKAPPAGGTAPAEANAGTPELAAAARNGVARSAAVPAGPAGLEQAT